MASCLAPTIERCLARLNNRPAGSVVCPQSALFNQEKSYVIRCTGKRQDEQLELSRLVDLLNERFGTEFTEEDQLFFDQVEESLVQDKELRALANANSKDTFLKHVAPDKLEEAFLVRHEKNADIVEKIYGDKGSRAVVLELLGERLYEGFREEAE